MNLKTTEGISAAFSAQYHNASKSRRFWPWVVGAVFCILIAIGLTIWIVAGWGVIDPYSIGSISGRIVSVGIAVTGATFCAKQYTKQKNISEDYAYKAVLAKSIVAFTEEIRKRDETKVAEYLGKVLSEIHQDPLRKRSNDEVVSNFDKAFDLIGRVKEKIPGIN